MPLPTHLHCSIRVCAFKPSIGFVLKGEPSSTKNYPLLFLHFVRVQYNEAHMQNVESIDKWKHFSSLYLPQKGLMSWSKTPSAIICRYGGASKNHWWLNGNAQVPPWFKVAHSPTVCYFGPLSNRIPNLCWKVNTITVLCVGLHYFCNTTPAQSLSKLIFRYFTLMQSNRKRVWKLRKKALEKHRKTKLR